MEKIDKESVLQTISSVMKDLQKKYNVKSIALFGSYVRGENNKDSDIDLLVEFEDHADLFDLTGLANFLENKLQHSVKKWLAGGVERYCFKRGNTSMRNVQLYLKDINTSIENIQSFIGNMTFEEFKNDDKTSSAVLRKLEIIGEAAKGVSDEIRNKYPEVPWKEMSGMRDRLIHSYFATDYQLVWTTIKERIIQIKPHIEKALSDFK